MTNFLFSNSLQRGLRAALLLVMVMVSLGPGGATPALAAPPSNDDFASAKTVNTIPYMDTGNTSEATEQTNEPRVPIACEGRFLDFGEKTVWYRYQPGGTTRSVSVDSLGTVYDTYIAVWRGTSLGNLTIVACDDDTFENLQSQLTFTAQAGQTYYIQVAGYAGTQDDPDQPNPGGPMQFHVTTFADVAGNYWAWRYIEGLAISGVTAGCTVNPVANYCPLGQITRAQMAVFLLKATHGSGYTPPAATGIFQDVPTNYWAAAWIEQLAEEGITAGCQVTPARFCPETLVSRDQMAVFLLKAKYTSSYTPPPATGTFFQDVPSGYWAGAWIEQLATEGITGGCAPGLYCPTTVVPRNQMAVFLVKTFNIPLKP